MVTLDKIYHASYVLKDVARKTDLIAAPRICPEAQVYLKTENLLLDGNMDIKLAGAGPGACPHPAGGARCLRNRGPAVPTGTSSPVSLSLRFRVWELLQVRRAPVHVVWEPPLRSPRSL